MVYYEWGNGSNTWTTDQIQAVVFNSNGAPDILYLYSPNEQLMAYIDFIHENNRLITTNISAWNNVFKSSSRKNHTYTASGKADEIVWETYSPINDTYTPSLRIAYHYTA